MNGCGAVFHGCKNNEHELMCPESIMECINKQNGCNLKLKRRDILSHLGLCPSMVERRYEYNQLPKSELGEVISSNILSDSTK